MRASLNHLCNCKNFIIVRMKKCWITSKCLNFCWRTLFSVKVSATHLQIDPLVHLSTSDLMFRFENLGNFDKRNVTMLGVLLYTVVSNCPHVKLEEKLFFWVSFSAGLWFWRRYWKCSHPSEILVSELRSKSEWERFPPALKISSFQREYLEITTNHHFITAVWWYR